MILIGIETLSVVISLAALICFSSEHRIVNEDMTTMLLIAPSARPILFVLTIGLLCIVIGLIIVNKPMAKMKEYLLS